jgi:hypothetical protein
MHLTLVLLMAAAPPLFPACKEPGKCGFISKTGTVVVPFTYADVAPFHESSAGALAGARLADGTPVFIDRAGKVAVKLPPESKTAWEWSEERGRVEVRGEIQNGETQRRIGFVDRTGKMVIAATFEAVTPFASGLAHTSRDRTYGYIDVSGRQVIKLGRTPGEEFASGLAKVSDYDKGIDWFIDKAGKRVLGPYASAESFAEGLAVVKKASGGTCQYIDTTGKVVIDTKWRACGSFSSELASVGDYGGPWGYIDRKGGLAVPVKHSANYRFANGRARRDDGALCGYIGRTGAVAIPPQFESCDDFSSGLARVRHKGTSAYIDTTGRIVWKASPAAK